MCDRFLIQSLYVKRYFVGTTSYKPVTCSFALTLKAIAFFQSSLEYVFYPCLKAMKRPSNLIITFILALAGIFVIFALGRIAVWVFSPPENEVEVEEDFESRQQQSDVLPKSTTNNFE